MITLSSHWINTCPVPYDETKSLKSMKYRAVFKKKKILKLFVNAIKVVCSYVLNRCAYKYDCVKELVQKTEVNIDKNLDILNYACI